MKKRLFSSIDDVATTTKNSPPTKKLSATPVSIAVPIPFDIWTLIASYSDIPTFNSIYRLNHENHESRIWNTIMEDRQFVFPKQLKCKALSHYDFRYVTRLDATSSRITDAELKKMSHVREINFRLCRIITDKGLGYLKSIRKINLANCIGLQSTFNYPNFPGITDDGLRYISPTVRSVDLSAWSNVTPDGLKYLENVQELNLNGSNINGLGYVHLKSIQILSMEFCSAFVTSDDIIAMMEMKNKAVLEEGKPKLTELNMAFNSMCVSDEVIQHLGDVEVLSLRSCAHFTGCWFSQLKNIKALDLSECISLTDQALCELSHMPHLKKLYLSGCPKITVSGIARFFQHRNHLSELCIGENNIDLTEEGDELLECFKGKTVDILTISDYISCTMKGLKCLEQSNINSMLNTSFETGTETHISVTIHGHWIIPAYRRYLNEDKSIIK